jgi:hypothetical protein
MTLLSSLMASMTMTCLGFVGAVVTGYKFHVMMFALYSTPVLVMIAVIIHFNGTETSFRPHHDHWVDLVLQDQTESGGQET